jgi:hypothetical protein
VSLAAGAKQQFTAEVTSRLDTSVTWTATAGAIGADGSYTAPAQPGTYLVRATSVANPRRASTAIVRVACNDPSCQADVALDSRESEIFAAAHAHSSTTFETSDEKTFSGPGTFNDTVMRQGGSSVCCSASGTGSQDSSVTAGAAGLSVTASGVVAGVESGGFDSSGFGRSEIVMKFTIGKTHHFSISGGQTVPVRGQAVISLQAGSSDVFVGNGASFNQAGTLAPGSYTLTIRFEATTFVGMPSDIPSSHGQFNVSLDVTV